MGALTQTLRETIEAADRAIAAEDFDEPMKFYADDASLVVKPRLTVTGKDSTRTNSGFAKPAIDFFMASMRQKGFQENEMEVLLYAESWQERMLWLSVSPKAIHVVAQFADRPLQFNELLIPQPCGLSDAEFRAGFA